MACNKLETSTHASLSHGCCPNELPQELKYVEIYPKARKNSIMSCFATSVSNSEIMRSTQAQKHRILME